MNKLRFLHVSDTHGSLPKLKGKYNLVIHSGDFFPNSYEVINRNLIREAAFQLDWLNQKLRTIKDLLDGDLFLFIPGNHDFLHPDLMEKTLVSAGINAINISEKIITVGEFKFYGFPYIPDIGGTWNYEKKIPEMEIEVDKMVSALNETHVDVLVTHAPLYQSLDLTHGNETVGSTVIANAIDYKINQNMLPKVICHGHVHENCGVTVRNNILISNAATTQHILELI